MEFLTEEQIREVTNGVIDEFLKPHFVELDLNVTGETMNSINARSESNKGIISANASLGATIYGRGPNKDQSEEAVKNWVKWFAPNVFQPWLDNRGFSGNPYILAYTIAREGSRRFRNNDPSEFLKILESIEVLEYIKSKITIFAKGNIDIIIKESLDKLKKS